MKVAATTDVRDVRAGSVLLIGTGFHYVQEVFPRVGKIRYRLWDERARAWRGVQDLAFPLAHLDAYELGEAPRLFPAPEGVTAWHVSTADGWLACWEREGAAPVNVWMPGGRMAPVVYRHRVGECGAACGMASRV